MIIINKIFIKSILTWCQKKIKDIPTAEKEAKKLTEEELKENQ